MNSLILRTTARLLVALLLLFSVFVLLRGHHEPGGGFIGGLVAATAFALFAFTEGPLAVRTAIRVEPIGIAAAGLAIALAAGLAGALAGAPFGTALWGDVAGAKVGTPLVFDVGVYLVVVGSVLALVIALEEAR